MKFAEQVCHAMRRFSSKSIDRVGGRVRHAALHRHAELVAELQARRAASSLVHCARAVEARGGGWGRRGGQRSSRRERRSHARRITVSRVSVMRGSVRCPEPRGECCAHESTEHGSVENDAEPDRSRIAHGMVGGGVQLVVAEGGRAGEEPADTDHDGAIPAPAGLPAVLLRCRSRRRRRRARSSSRRRSPRPTCTAPCTA